MKKQLLLFMALVFLLSWSISPAQMTAKQVIDEQNKRHEVTSETTVNVMLLVESNGDKEQRTIKTSFKDIGDGETRMLVVFDEPASVRGTAMLTWNHKDRDSDQWLYLPSQKKLQRIAEGSKKNYFMGTDFTFEDMEPEEDENFTYTMLDPETVDGQECYVIEASPSDREKLKKSAYSKRKLWIRKDIFFTIKIEFYDHRNRLVKTQTNLDLKNIEGTVWRAQKALMDNHSRNHKTLTAIQSDKINVALDESMFTERYVLSEKHIQ